MKLCGAHANWGPTIGREIACTFQTEQIGQLFPFQRFRFPKTSLFCYPLIIVYLLKINNPRGDLIWCNVCNQFYRHHLDHVTALSLLSDAIHECCTTCWVFNFTEPTWKLGPLNIILECWKSNKSDSHICSYAICLKKNYAHNLAPTLRDCVDAPPIYL